MPSNGIAIGLGIAPRLRLPLPDTVSPAFKAHVARHTGPRDNRYAYHRSDQPISVAASHVRHHSGRSGVLLRLPLGALLIAGGFLAILPIFGLWMIPLGLLLLAIGLPMLRPVVSAIIIRLRRKWELLQRKRRNPS